MIYIHVKMFFIQYYEKNDTGNKLIAGVMEYKKIWNNA
jgi:hypothetical protein